jgi:hypothetical protein
MQDELARAQHYRALALRLRDMTLEEPDAARRKELLDLAAQYEILADKLVGKYSGRKRA